MLHEVMQQHVCNIKINQKRYRQIYYLNHFTKGEQIFSLVYCFVLELPYRNRNNTTDSTQWSTVMWNFALGQVGPAVYTDAYIWV